MIDIAGCRKVNGQTAAMAQSIRGTQDNLTKRPLHSGPCPRIIQCEGAFSRFVTPGLSTYDERDCCKGAQPEISNKTTVKSALAGLGGSAAMDYQHAQIAEIYDIANPRAQDTEFYLSLAGPRPVSVLDLGCGTGTLCCALAERGHQVTGVDPAAAMLAVARRKPHAEHVEWVESSAQSYKSNRRFDLIVMTGHAFQILLSDVDSLVVLETMRGHLKERGRAAFETRNPRVNWAGEWSERVRVLPGGQLLETLEITGENDEFISFRTSYRSPHVTLTTSSTLRFPSQEHVAALIARSGLAIREVLGDWNAGPFEAARSREIIFIAEIAR